MMGDECSPISGNKARIPALAISVQQYPGTPSWYIKVGKYIKVI